MDSYYKLMLSNKIKRSLILSLMLLIALPGFSKFPYEDDLEDLNRGVVAVKSGTNIFISWRLLGDEPDTVTFNLYRIAAGAAAVKVNDEPIDSATNYLDTEASTSETNQYYVCSILDGVEQEPSDTVSFWANNYYSLPIDLPDGGTNNSGTYTYTANDVSVGDVDGDGEYEYILKWDPSNSKDNSQSGYTGNVYLDAYDFDGTRLWRIDLGVNIRAGAHYTQFMVYDFDKDGKAEVACKTAPGTIDGLGNYISKGPAATADHSKDYRNSSGYILSGPEYLTVFNGETGAEVTTVTYLPGRGKVSAWGDSYGNRSDRFLACVAYVHDERPSLVMCRGMYTRSVLVAWDFDGDTLTRVWTFDTKNGYSNYAGQGNHQLSVADVDYDGFDEIIYGSMAVDNDGTGLWTAGFGHGDAMHVADIMPERLGLEKWGVYEESGQPGGALLDARTGEVIFALDITDDDVGRGCAGDLVASNYGMEMWGGTNGLVNAYNERVGSSPASTNHVVWWDGDLSRELLNNIYVTKYSGGTLLNASGCHSNNSTKANPSLQADLFGDWREEIIWPTNDNNYLRIYTTTDVTEYRIPTLMHDHTYRMAIAWQNVEYNQPPHTGFYLGTGMFDHDSVTIPLYPRGLEVVNDSSIISLAWWTSTDTDLKYYYIYRANSSDGEYLKIDSVSSESYSYDDPSITLDKKYLYKIRAIDIYGNLSDFSDSVIATASLRPDIPTGLDSKVFSATAFLFWEVHPSPHVTGYNLYRANTEDGEYIKINSELIDEITYIDSSLNDGTEYYYTLTAVYTTGYESFQSDTILAIPKETWVYQAEDALITNGVVETEYVGFNGTGYVDLNNNNGHIEFQYVYGADYGMYQMYYYYSNGNILGKVGNIIVNDRTYRVKMLSTGEWDTYVVDTLEIPIYEGFANNIEFVTTGSGYGNLDQIVIGERIGDVGIEEPYVQKTEELVTIAPNPFTNETSINVTVDDVSTVQIEILNIMGQKVADVATGETVDGSARFAWNGADNAGNKQNPGIYLCRVITDNKNIIVSRVVLE